MDYYRKLMGNGAVTSKFRLVGSNNPEVTINPDKDDKLSDDKVESPHTHHPNNCNRCYRLKKKCSREKPKCANCNKTRNDCQYVLRSNKRRKRENTDKKIELKLNANGTPNDITQENEAGNDIVHHNNIQHNNLRLTHDSVNRIIIEPRLSQLVSVSSLLSEEPKNNDNNVNLSNNNHTSNSINSLDNHISPNNDSSPKSNTTSLINNSHSHNTNDTNQNDRDRVQNNGNIINNNHTNHTNLSGHNHHNNHNNFNRHNNHNIHNGHNNHNYHDSRNSHNTVNNHNCNTFSDFKMREGEKVNKRDRQISDKVMNQLMKSTDFKDEYITMKLSQDLSLIFVDNYFDNFELIYPFITRIEIEKQISKINFEQENIINLDIFLILSIGCLIYDYNNKSNKFKQFFKEKLNSIIDMISYNQLNIKILILLVIYSLLTLNQELSWNLIGVLTRLVIKYDLYFDKDSDEDKGNKTETEKEKDHGHKQGYAQERGKQKELNEMDETHENYDEFDNKSLFYTIYNLDKEISLIMKKPSQLPQDIFINFNQINDANRENIEIINQFIILYQYYNQLLTLNLLKSFEIEKLNELLKNLETWRSTTSKLIYKYYVKSIKLQDYINFINLHYYYLLIEIDQLSPVESFQFTLQFLSNSFSLILQEDITNKLSINNLYWYKKLFNVIKFSLKSLNKLLESNLNKVDLSLKLTEFNSNLQLFINLLNYLYNNNFMENNEVNEIVIESLDILNKLNGLLGNYNAILSNQQDKKVLLQETRSIYEKYIV